ncbi:MAG: hypothetical protein WD048_13535 [Chitinophagales bacterium]
MKPDQLKTFVILFFISFFLITMDLKGQENSGYLMVNVYQSRYQDYSKVIVTENGKVLENQDIEVFVPENMESYQLTVNNIIDKYKRKNYKLVEVIYGSTQHGRTVERTFLFEKVN